MRWPTTARFLIAGLVLVALGLAGAVPLVFRGVSGAPEFYGAFTAAIVAAIAVFLGAYYQAELTRRRDDSIRRQAETAEAIDLCFWLEHAADEIDFISDVLIKARDNLIADGKSQLDMPLEQFREVVSAKFFAELLPRAKTAARLPPEIAGIVVQTIYQTFHVADRILLLRGASQKYSPTVEQINKLLFVVKRRAQKLHEAATLIESHLNGIVTIAASIEE